MATVTCSKSSSVYMTLTPSFPFVPLTMALVILSLWSGVAI